MTRNDGSGHVPLLKLSAIPLQLAQSTEAGSENFAPFATEKRDQLLELSSILENHRL